MSILTLILSFSCAPAPASPEELQGYEAKIEQLERDIQTLKDDIEQKKGSIAEVLPKHATSNSGFTSTQTASKTSISTAKRGFKYSITMQGAEKANITVGSK